MTRIAVARLPRDPGPAAWNEILPPRAAAESLSNDVTADWLVIGAGFAGIAAARRLTQLRPNDRIVMVEACRVASGPAGRNSGFMIDLPHDLASEDYGGDGDRDRDQILMNRTGIRFAADATEEYELDTESFDPCGKTNAAATERGLRANTEYARHLSSLGEKFEMIDAKGMKDLCGLDYYQGGIYTPGAAMIQPAKFVHGCVDGLSRSNRFHLYENSPVTALQRNATAWRAVTPSGSISAPKIILAVNGHAESFGFFKRRLMHVFTYASMTRRLTADEVGRLGGEPRWGFTPSDPLGTTVRRISGDGGDRIVVRNRFTYDPSMEVNAARIARVANNHDRAFKARFPMLSGVEMEFRWGGRLCLSRNNVPAFGEVENGIFSVCCQNGLGTAKGTLAGMLGAELACGLESEALQVMRRQPEPVQLPPEPLAYVGANAFIRWGEMRAGREL